MVLKVDWIYRKRKTGAITRAKLCTKSPSISSVSYATKAMCLLRKSQFHKKIATHISSKFNLVLFLVNVDNSSASFFRCYPLKITEITLAFGVIINKNVCKTFVCTKIHENIYKICRRGAERRLAPLTEHNMLTRHREIIGAPHRG